MRTLFNKNRFFGITGVNALPQHDAWPGSPLAILPISEIRLQIEQSPATPISEIRHPDYQVDYDNWLKWEAVYEGGDAFVELYVKRFSRREEWTDFNRRKSITPIAAHAKSSVNEIKNSIFQRMSDIKRLDGPASYLAACRGDQGGVDRQGASMVWFLGAQILPQLLVKKKVGAWVDNEILGPTIADKGNKHPYIYRYKAEDILSWERAPNGSKMVFSSVLLREWEYTKYDDFNLPAGSKEIFRYAFIGDDGFVRVQMYNDSGNPIGDEQRLNLKRIPFVAFEISDSLLKDVANHQIALTNMESSDVNYSIMGNFPLYTEQFDPKSENPYIKNAQRDWNNGFDAASPDETCPPTPQQPTESLNVGVSQGRRYGAGLERPGFIAPPTDPLRASMEKGKNLKEDIRTLVHLALSNIQPKMASAESKKADQSGLESGLSYIGLELQHGERAIAEIWAEYENSTTITQINYPTLWSLETEEERYAKIDRLKKVRDTIPSRTFQKEITKQIAVATLATRVSEETLIKIQNEIDASKVTTSDPDVLLTDYEAGLVTGKTTSEARGYPVNEYDEAQTEKADRAAKILTSQTSKLGGLSVSATETDVNPAARGVPDLGGNAPIEKQGLPTRGPAK